MFPARSRRDFRRRRTPHRRRMWTVRPAHLLPLAGGPDGPVVGPTRRTTWPALCSGWSFSSVASWSSRRPLSGSGAA